MKNFKKILCLLTIMAVLFGYNAQFAYAQSEMNAIENSVNQTSVSLKYFSIIVRIRGDKPIPEKYLYTKQIGDVFYSGYLKRGDVTNVFINGVRYYDVNYFGTIKGYPAGQVLSIER